MTSYTAFNFGFKKAIPTMLGVIIGWTLLIILLQLTSAAVFEKYQFIQTTIKILGSVYLLYMAYKLSFGGKTNEKKHSKAQYTHIFYGGCEIVVVEQYVGFPCLEEDG